MSRGQPDVKAIFTAARELPAGSARLAYLSDACGGDDELRRRVEELLAADALASEVLGPAGTRPSGASTRADEATAAVDPAPLAEPKPASERTPSTEASLTIEHTPNRPSGEPGTTVLHGDPGSDRNDGGLAQGTVLRYFGDYEIRRELGRGGMGVVYEARQVSLNRPVALKMVKAGLLAGDEELRRFQNEAEAVALLDHPGIVPVYEVGVHQGQHYFTMKLVTGGSLVPILGRYKDNPRRAARLVAEAAEAVSHAHARGILHRDLKPANLLVDDAGHAHVTDFGLAKRVEADVEFTQSGAILGTPAYMAPEQTTGRRGSVTTATDVYGLGSVLYALLTGKAPFGGGSVVETLDAVRNHPPEPPSKRNTRISRDLETICLKCLEKDPRRRYPTAQALADDLNAWLDSRPISARRVGAAERAWLWCKRRPAVAALSVATLLALFGGTAATVAVQAAANTALDRKNTQLTNALGREAKGKTELEEANTELKAAHTRVEQRYKLAVAAIETFYTGVSEDFLLKEPQFRDLRDQLLKSASDFYEKLGGLLQDDTELTARRALLAANYTVAKLAATVGRREDALALHRRVLAGREALAAAPGADPTLAVDVSLSQWAVGLALEDTGKIDEALATYERARKAVSAADGGPPDDAPARSAFADASMQLGLLLRKTGRTDDALRALTEARDIQAELAAAEPGDLGQQSDLAKSLLNIGILLSETGKPVEALAAFEASQAIRQKLVDAYPSPRFRADLARSHYNLGNLLNATGRSSDALQAWESARSLYQDLTESHPAVTEFQHALAWCHTARGTVLGEMGRLAEAQAAHEAAQGIFQRLTESNPAVTQFARDLAASRTNLGVVLNAAGKPADALAAFQAGRAVFQKLTAAHPTVTEFQSGLADSHNNIGILQKDMGWPQDALASFAAARAIQERLAREHPEAPDHASALGATWSNMASLELKAGHLAEAREMVRNAIAWQQKALAAYPRNPQYRQFLVNHLTLMMHAARGLGDAKELAETERALAELRASDPKFAALDARLAAVIGSAAPRDNAERLALAQRAYDTKRHATAARLWAEALATDPPLAEDRRAQHRYNAACAAVLASSSSPSTVREGESGGAEPALDDAAKARLREQALGWLKAELAVWAKLLETATPPQRATITQILDHWQADTDLAGVRDADALRSLPDSEREAWRALWAELTAHSKAAVAEQ